MYGVHTNFTSSGTDSNFQEDFLVFTYRRSYLNNLLSSKTGAYGHGESIKQRTAIKS